MTSITQAEFARRRGFTQQYVRNLINRQVLTLRPDGKLNLEAAEAALASIEQPAKARSQRPAGSDQLSRALLTSRVKREIETAKRLERRNKIEAGEFLPIEDVKEAAFKRARITRDALLNIPDRIAPLLAVEQNPQLVHKLLSDEIRLALENLAGADPKSGRLR